MRNWLEAHKPSGPARVHLLLAAIMWTVVGTLLLLFGSRWAWAGHYAHVWVALLVAVAIGSLKARYVLARTARRAIERIRVRGDGQCVGGFLSARTWLFVVLMAGTGRLLRGGLLPRPITGLIYAAVGTALLLAAERFWQAWYRYTSET